MIVHFGALWCGCLSRTLTFDHPPNAHSGQAPLRLGKPLCIALEQAPALSGTQEE